MYGIPSINVKSLIASFLVRFIIHRHLIPIAKTTAFPVRTSRHYLGDAGYTSLLRVFQSMDINDDKTLSLSEFKNALKSLQLVEKESEVRLLFEYFDADHSESIRYHMSCIHARC